MNRHAQAAQKRTKTNMTNEETTSTAASVAEQGAPVAPKKGSSKKQATAKKNAPKAQKPAKGAKSKKQAKPKRETGAGPRSGSKGAKVLEMIGRTNGATLAELMKATEWQAHSIRGFLSTASKKRDDRIVEER